LKNQKVAAFLKKFDDFKEKKLQVSNIVYRNLITTNIAEIRHNKLKCIKYFAILKTHCNKKEVENG